jgi:hypothetical protein
VALRRAGGVERAANPEVGADVVEGVDPVGVGVVPAVVVAQDRTVLPAVPELGDDLQELGGAGVAVPVRRAFDAEVVRLGLARRGDDVPSGPAAADVVQRGELAGHVEGLVVGGGDGRDQADVVGDRGQRGQQGQGLQPAERVVPDVAPQGQPVGEEDRVEPAPLGDLGETLVVADVGDVGGGGARVPPGRLVVPDAHQKGVQMQLPCGPRGHQVVLHVEKRRSRRTRNWLKSSPRTEIVMIPAYMSGTRKLNWA